VNVSDFVTKLFSFGSSDVDAITSKDSITTNNEITPENLFTATNAGFAIHEVHHVVNQWQEGMTPLKYIFGGIVHSKNKYEIEAEQERVSKDSDVISIIEELM
jgi:hypothetical protein